MLVPEESISQCTQAASFKSDPLSTIANIVAILTLTYVIIVGLIVVSKALHHSKYSLSKLWRSIADHHREFKNVQKTSDTLLGPSDGNERDLATKFMSRLKEAETSVSQIQRFFGWDVKDEGGQGITKANQVRFVCREDEVNKLIADRDERLAKLRFTLTKHARRTHLWSRGCG